LTDERTTGLQDSTARGDPRGPLRRIASPFHSRDDIGGRPPGGSCLKFGDVSNNMHSYS
jgi:hypothetical protein